MTEDEAKTKWCPFTRLVNGSIDGGGSEHNTMQAVFNRVVDGAKWSFPQGGACIASACMAWRANGKPELSHARALASERRLIDAIRELRHQVPGLGLKEAKDIVEGDAPWPADSTGYCGLAGQPQ